MTEIGIVERLREKAKLKKELFDGAYGPQEAQLARLMQIEELAAQDTIDELTALADLVEACTRFRAYRGVHKEHAESVCTDPRTGEKVASALGERLQEISVDDMFNALSRLVDHD